MAQKAPSAVLGGMYMGRFSFQTEERSGLNAKGNRESPGNNARNITSAAKKKSTNI